MKISNNTLMALKWMSSINGGIHIEPGSLIYSKNEVDTIRSVVEVEEVFPMDFITSNLQKFLATVGLFEDPDLEFGEKEVQITSTDGRNKTTFYQSNAVLVQQPNQVPSLKDSVHLTFTLKAEDLKKIFKAASVMSLNTIRISANNGTIYLSTLNPSVQTTDEFDIIIGTCDPEIDAVYNYPKASLNLITDFDYEVQINKPGLSKFSAVNSPFKKFDIFVVPELKIN